MTNDASAFSASEIYSFAFLLLAAARSTWKQRAITLTALMATS